MSPCTPCGRARSAALGFANLALRRQLASTTLIQQRRDACLPCAQRRGAHPRRVATLDRCDACGCFLRPKTQLAQERCPLDRWPPPESQT